MITCPRRSWGQKGVDYWREDHTCSYCGSLNPNLLIDLVERGAVEIGPTDKVYKIYVKHDNGQDTKAYFQHFDVSHMQKFVDLINAKKMRIGLPGYFYTKPFFIV